MKWYEESRTGKRERKTKFLITPLAFTIARSWYRALSFAALVSPHFLLLHPPRHTRKVHFRLKFRIYVIYCTFIASHSASCTFTLHENFAAIVNAHNRNEIFISCSRFYSARFSCVHFLLLLSFAGCSRTLYSWGNAFLLFCFLFALSFIDY